MSKKRVYDLAKEYGMSGQELAAKLRDLGFTDIKSHMTALDDFKVMEIQGRLEAYGIVGESSRSAGEDRMGGLVVKRKKKKKTEESAAEEAVVAPESEEVQGEEAVEPAPAAPLEEAPAQTPPIEVAEIATEEVGTPAEPVAAAPATEPSEVEAATPAETLSAAGPASDSEPVEAAAEADAPVESVPEPEPTAPAAEAEAPRAEQAPTTPPLEAELEPAAPVTDVSPAAGSLEVPAESLEVPAESLEVPAESLEVPAESLEVPAESLEVPAESLEVPAESLEVPAGAPAEGLEVAAAEGEPEVAAGKGAKPEIVRPSSKRRTGKVVGFIDPSSFQVSQQARKPESRRLRSRDDDFAPNVQPTLARNRRGPFSRGDQGVRGQLTAQQLRERESGRFLRRRGPGAPTGGGRGRGGGGRRGAASGSPHAGKLVHVAEPISIKKLAEAMSVTVNQVISVAMSQMGQLFNQNALIDSDTATLLATEFEVVLEIKEDIAAEESLLAEFAQMRADVADENLVSRAPTVAFLGHVDHGKTTLIDTIRKSRITHHESGGITQHIGAYQVSTKKGHTLTIVDTPGHAAFTAMRARGAKAVDIVVLVVASDDGVMPQTIEAIQHARSAKTPVVVALNKMDKVEANPDKVKNELAANDITPEEWGGDVAIVPVSALQGDGIEELLERVFLESEVLELSCHPDGPASGVVLEAEIQQGKGKVAHLLIQDGSLNRGDVILAGEGYGKVRSIHNDRGKQIKSAGPAMPVEVTGLGELPGAGENFHVVGNLDSAKEVASERALKSRQMSQVERKTISRENLFEAVADQERTSINLILKTDVQGSVQVIREQLNHLVHDEVAVQVLGASVGQVAESDVDHAITTGSTILAFHVGTNNKARQAAERNGVEIRNYQVIYELLDDVKMMMEGSLAPDIVEEVSGHAEIRRIFKSSKVGNIAGCIVLDGTIGRDSKIRLLRDGTVVHAGEIGTLRRETDDTKEVREGFECGIVIRNYNDIKLGDVIEASTTKEIKRTLEL